MPSSSKSTSPPSTPLHKGQACLNCRRRKIRCDGKRPACTPCTQSSASFRDCEYGDVGVTRTQMLTEQISLLEARLQELERPDASAPAVTLSAPYKQSRPTPPSSSSSRIMSRAISPALSQPNVGLFPPKSEYNAHGLMENVPWVLHQAVIHDFVNNSSPFGFFLDKSRFTAAALGSDSRPTSSLLHVVYLWGNDLSHPGPSDPNLLRAAVQATAQALGPNVSHPRKVLEYIQAEVLLANYFLRNTRFLEGKQHIAAAASMIFASGMHKIRSGPGNAFHLQQANTPPADAVEEGERVDAFWTVLMLNNSWQPTDPPILAYGGDSFSRIDTPWPLNVTEYTQGLLPPSSSHTVQMFLTDASRDGFSPLALHAKASILFEQACKLVLRYRPDLSQPDAAMLQASFSSLDSLITRFTLSLPAIHTTEGKDDRRRLLVTRTLAIVARIELHKPFVGRNASSEDTLVSSFQSLGETIRSTDLVNFEYVDPVLGILWGTACVLAVSMVARSRHEASSRGGVPGAAAEQRSSTLMGALESITQGMSVFAHRGCKVMAGQLVRVRETVNQTLGA